jgi:hypothetical protein
MTQAVPIRVGNQLLRATQITDLAEKCGPVDPELARGHPLLDIAVIGPCDPHHASGGLR